jgi:hypothetical protein
VFQLRTKTSELLNGYPRTHVVIRGLSIDANASSAYGSTSNNTSGYPIRAQGLSYFFMRDVLLWRGASGNFTADNYDYGGSIGIKYCNNHHFDNVFSLGTQGNGLELYAGDSAYRNLTVGAVAGNGIITGAPVHNSSVWNIQGHGIYMINDVFINGCELYDIGKSGVYMAGGGHQAVTGCKIQNCGEGLSGSANDRAGILISGSCTSALVAANLIYDNLAFSSGTPTMLAGVRVTADVPFNLGDNTIIGPTTELVFVAGSTLTNTHGNLGTTLFNHPGFMAADQVQIKNGTQASPGLSMVGSPTTGLFRHGADIWGLSFAGTETMAIKSDQIRVGAPSNPSTSAALDATGLTNAAGGLSLGTIASSATGPGITFSKARGATVSARTIVNAGDTLGTINWQGADGAAYAAGGAYIRAIVAGTPASGDVRATLSFATGSAAGVASVALFIDTSQQVGIGTVIPTTTLHVNGAIRAGSFTVGTLPAAATAGAGAMAMATDSSVTTFNTNVANGGANKVMVVSDGTNWKVF